MKILGPTRFHRLNEAGGLVYLFTGFFLILCLISYHPQDPSWNSVTGATHALNLTGLAGSYIADLCFQLLGLSAFSLPVLLWLLAWKWIRSAAIQAAGVKVFGAVVLFLSISTALSIRPFWRPWNGAFSAGGVIGILIADSLLSIAQRDGNGAVHRHLPDSVAVPDFQFLHGGFMAIARAGWPGRSASWRRFYDALLSLGAKPE